MSALMNRQDITDAGDEITGTTLRAMTHALDLKWDDFGDELAKLAQMYDGCYAFAVEAVRAKMVNRWVLKSPIEGSKEYDNLLEDCEEFADQLMRIYHMHNLLDGAAPRLIADDDGEVKAISSVLSDVEFVEYSVHHCGRIFGVKEEEEEE